MLGFVHFQAAGAIMDPRSFEDLLRGDAYLPPRVTAVVPETVKFAVKELAEIRSLRQLGVEIRLGVAVTGCDGFSEHSTRTS